MLHFDTARYTPIISYTNEFKSSVPPPFFANLLTEFPQSSSLNKLAELWKA